MNIDSSFRRVPDGRRRSLLGALLLTPALPALAQFRVEVSGVGLTQMPIALVPFRGEPGSPQPISAIIRADLERSGQFRAVDAAGAAMDETTRPDMSSWRQRGADSLAGGSVSPLADGRWDVRFRLWDVVRDADLGGQGYVVPKADLRLAAHKSADYIYEKLTGDKGVFSTRIAYVTQNGKRYTLWVADADGENAQPALSSPESIISPRWSPDGRQILYSMAVGGNTDIYRVSADGGTPVRLTSTPGIDVGGSFSPDGKKIVFESDRSGGQQVYTMNIDGSNQQRISFGGGRAATPEWSPRGDLIAFTRMGGGEFRIGVMTPSGGGVRMLTNSWQDEAPTWSPNGRVLQFFRTSPGRDGKSSLWQVDLTGVNMRRLPTPQDGSDPSWGPVLP